MAKEEHDMTVTETLPAGTVERLRLAAMQVIAGDSSAEEMLAWAANDALVERIAARSGRPAEDLRNEMIFVSAVAGMLAREGYTRDKCRFVLGIDKTPAPVPRHERSVRTLP